MSPRAPGVTVDIQTSARKFVVALNGLADAFRQVRVQEWPLPGPMDDKRACKAHSRRLRMSLKAHRR